MVDGDICTSHLSLDGEGTQPKTPVSPKDLVNVFQDFGTSVCTDSDFVRSSEPGVHNGTLITEMTGNTGGPGFYDDTLVVNENRRLTADSLPDGLRYLAFGANFDQSIAGLLLPHTLLVLAFGRSFNFFLDRVHLPGSILHISFGERFNQPLDDVCLPNGLISLVFGDGFGRYDQKIWRILFVNGVGVLGVMTSLVPLLFTSGRDALFTVQVFVGT